MLLVINNQIHTHMRTDFPIKTILRSQVSTSLMLVHVWSKIYHMAHFLWRKGKLIRTKVLFLKILVFILG